MPKPRTGTVKDSEPDILRADVAFWKRRALKAEADVQKGREREEALAGCLADWIQECAKSREGSLH